MSDYKYDASLLDMAIELANRYKDKANLTEDFIKGLEGARGLLNTEEDDKKWMEDYFNGIK